MHLFGRAAYCIKNVAVCHPRNISFLIANNRAGDCVFLNALFGMENRTLHNRQRLRHDKKKDAGGALNQR
jgi:hypothetical protein